MKLARLAALTLALLLLATACGPGQKVDESALRPKVESTKIYAVDGSLITTLKQEENREIIPIEQIPQHVQDAVVAIEDQRFHHHKGVDLKAILRAIKVNATTGRVVEGGSTITQQLVRNALAQVGKEQTLERKLREASYAYSVDKAYAKKKILELYLNTIYFGQGAYGVQTASRVFFDKDIKDLSLAEGALLAGLIKSPVNYDPRTNADDALSRRNVVLDRMVVNGFVSPDQAASAKGEGLGVKEKVDSDRYPAAYFIDYVTRQIQKSDEFKVLGESDLERGNALFRKGLRIHTTIDLRIQEAAEESIRKVLDQPAKDPSASLVAIEPKSGHIKAMVGGSDFFAPQDQDPCVRIGAINSDGSRKTCAKVNLALGQAGGGSGRQTGSAFKPFVLAAALSEGKSLGNIYQAHACMNIPKADAGKPRHVCSYEESGSGPTTIREATVRSINTVYAQMVMDVGAADVVETARDMGICKDLESILPPDRDCHLDPVPSAALGANAVSPLEMASAFTVFPNLGKATRPVSITKITDAVGNLLWEPPQDNRVEVLKPSVAYLSTQAMEEVIVRGTAARHGRIGRPAFGKTGTAQEWRDAWFVGGAGTDLVASVAVFWPDGEIEMKPDCPGDSKYKIVEVNGQRVAQPPKCRPTRIRVTGGSWPTQIWQIFMLKALEGIPASTFPVPDLDMVRVSVDVTRNCLPNPYTPKDVIRTVAFLKGTEPTEICKEPKGAVALVVPRVVGYPQDQAVKLLQDAGFEVRVTQEVSRLYPPGRITRQDPEPGFQAATGSIVTLWVSSPANREVPDVINMTEFDAKVALESENLRAKVFRSAGCTGNDQRKCFVWDQDPEPGAPAADGDIVSIYVKPRQ